MQDPTCAKVMIEGAVLPVPEKDEATAGHLLFSRHPSMKTWPADHSFKL